MTIYTYTNKSPNNFVHKDVVAAMTVDGVLRDNTDYINPAVQIAFETISTPSELGNYAYIPQFKRWYYITDVVHNYQTCGLYTFMSTFLCRIGMK